MFLRFVPFFLLASTQLMAASPGARKINDANDFSLQMGTSGKCLDIRDHASHVGAVVQLWDCTFESQQKFTAVEVDPAGTYQIWHKQKCLAPAFAGVDAPVLLAECDGSNRLQDVEFLEAWRGTVKYFYPAANLCLSHSGTEGSNGTAFVLKNCDSVNLFFVLENQPVFNYERAQIRVVQQNTNLCFSRNQSLANGTSYALLPCGNYETDNNGVYTAAFQSEFFEFEYTSNGNYRMYSAWIEAKKCLSAQENRTENGTPILQWDCHGGPDQDLKVEPVRANEDLYRIRFATSGRCLSVKDNRPQLQDCQDDSNQVFILKQH